MSVQWHAPCGCIIEFEGQLVDKGAPIKEHKGSCTRHSISSDFNVVADLAFDDVKMVSRAMVDLEDQGLNAPEVEVVYEATGPIKLILPPSASNKSQIQGQLNGKYGPDKFVVA